MKSFRTHFKKIEAIFKMVNEVIISKIENQLLCMCVCRGGGEGGGGIYRERTRGSLIFVASLGSLKENLQKILQEKN